MYLEGDEKRLFLNTNLGCSSNCSYCYLSAVELVKGKDPDKKIGINELIVKLENTQGFIKGKQGTKLSIGCYSECWDQTNKKDTIALINKLLEYGNPIQIATKQYISDEDFSKITKINLNGQISIYISSSSISMYKQYEQGTVEPRKRFESFELIEKFNIPMYLYMKPVIKDVTINDLELYKKIIENIKLMLLLGQCFQKMEMKWLQLQMENYFTVLKYQMKKLLEKV